MAATGVRVALRTAARTPAIAQQARTTGHRVVVPSVDRREFAGESRMAYDRMLAERIRSVLSSEPGVVERAMFGGLAFMVDGNMACGVVDGV